MRRAEMCKAEMGDSDEVPGVVVVIDDDRAVLDSFQFMLEMAGFRVQGYASARDYLAEVSEQPLCLILDQHMPHMSGLELASTLRSRGDMIPILLITAAPTPALIARAASCGVERVLGKPPPEEDVIAFVQRNGRMRALSG